MNRPLTAVILAAGQGTRMRSRLPKVLHRLAGKPLLDHVIDACLGAAIPRPVVVVGAHQQEVADHVRSRCEVVVQSHPRGTGDAVARVPRERLAAGDVLVLNGDAPLITSATLERLVEDHLTRGSAATLLSVIDPARSDGRVVRFPDGTLDRIVEDADAEGAVRDIQEFNVGVYCFRGPELCSALGSLSTDNRQRELYLPDVLSTLKPVEVVRLADPAEALGINDRVELARAEAAFKERILHRLMVAGVTVVDPASTFIEAEVQVGEDTVIEPFTLIRGRTSIGSGCSIGPAADISDAEIGDGCRIERSWLRGCRIGAGSDCGPYAKIRPGSEIGPQVHVGSFAEIVRSQVGRDSKVPHFSYLGDAEVGERVNVAAGTITANYDGATRTKHRTVVEDDVFLGVDTLLRAPVRLGRGASTGAGSVVTKDVPEGAMVVGVPARVVRTRQGSGGAEALGGQDAPGKDQKGVGR